jgi:hypothetical protein
MDSLAALFLKLNFLYLIAARRWAAGRRGF